MKICKNCGASQSDERSLCVDCGSVLGSPVDAATEKAVLKKQRASLGKLERDGDFLALKPFDAACGIVTLALGLTSGILCLFPKFVGETRPFFAAVLVLGLILGITALTPKLSWKLEKLRLSFRVDNVESLIPSAGFVIGRKICTYAGVILVAALFCFGICGALGITVDLTF